MTSSQPDVRFHLLYDDDIGEDKIKTIIDLLPNSSATVAEKVQDGKYPSGGQTQDDNVYLILLAHSWLEDCDDNVPRYFGDNEEAISEELNKYKVAWIASCGTVNVDVSKVVPGRKICPLIIDGGLNAPPEKPAPFIPFITVNWFIAFLTWANAKKPEWWNPHFDKSGRYTHPIRAFSQEQHQSNDKFFNWKCNILESQIRNDIWEHVVNEMDDTLLFPYRMSFPEMFHMGVFVARLPSKELQLLSGGDALRAYFSVKAKNQVGGLFKPPKSKPTLKDANDWYGLICDSSGQESPTPSDEQKAHFNACMTMSSCLFKGDNLCKDPSVIVERLLCVSQLTKPVNKRTLAVFCRKSTQNGDPRVGGGQLDALLKLIIEVANAKGFRIAFFDKKPSDDVITFCKKQKIEYVLCSDHHEEEQQKKRLSSNAKDEIRHLHSTKGIVNQLRYLRACIEDLGVVAAIGVHGGLMDVLNVLGVPPTCTYRFFGKGVRENKQEHWKQRTDKLLKSVFDDANGTTHAWKVVPCRDSVGEFLDAVPKLETTKSLVVCETGDDVS